MGAVTGVLGALVSLALPRPEPKVTPPFVLRFASPCPACGELCTWEQRALYGAPSRPVCPCERSAR